MNILVTGNNIIQNNIKNLSESDSNLITGKVNKVYCGLIRSKNITSVQASIDAEIPTGYIPKIMTSKNGFTSNGFKNDLKHTEGVISMARSAMPDSAGSQFFIMHKTSPHLDGAYAAFGKTIEGMDVVNKIAETRTDYADRPLVDKVMEVVNEFKIAFEVFYAFER